MHPILWDANNAKVLIKSSSDWIITVNLRVLEIGASRSMRLLLGSINRISHVFNAQKIETKDLVESISIKIILV